MTNLVHPVQKVLQCSKYPARDLDHYCETCKEVICRDCILKVHRDHQYDLATDAFPREKDVLLVSILDTLGESLALGARQEELIAQLDQMTRKKLKNVAAQQDQLELVATRLKSCCGFLQESLRIGSQVEIQAMVKLFLQHVQYVTSTFKPMSRVPKEEANLECLVAVKLN